VKLLSLSYLICGEYEVHDHAVANESAGQETWRLLSTSFDATKLALDIFHNRWQSAVNQSHICIDMKLARNVYFIDILFEDGVRKCIVRLD